MYFRLTVHNTLWVVLLFISRTANSWIVDELLSSCEGDPDLFNYCSSCFSVHFCSGFEINCTISSEACSQSGGSIASCVKSSEVPECECPDKVPTAITDPYDPQQYFVCLGGDPIPYKCKDGWQFDEATNKCIEILTTTMMPSTQEVTAEPCDPGQVGVFPIDCTSYKVCLPGTPAVEFDCDVGQIFDPNTNSCENYELFSCPPETGTDTVPDSLDCTIFHICSDGVEQGNPITCPPSAPYFEPDLKQCAGNTSDVTDKCPSGCLPDYPPDVVCNDDFARYGIDCKSYFQCTKDGSGNFVPIRYDCPDGFFYNNSENYCDLPGNVPECPAVLAQEANAFK